MGSGIIGRIGEADWRGLSSVEPLGPGRGFACSSISKKPLPRRWPREGSSLFQPTVLAAGEAGGRRRPAVIAIGWRGRGSCRSRVQFNPHDGSLAAECFVPSDFPCDRHYFASVAASDCRYSGRSRRRWATRVCPAGDRLEIIDVPEGLKIGPSREPRAHFGCGPVAQRSSTRWPGRSGLRCHVRT